MVSLLMTPRDRVLAKLDDHATTAALFTRLHKLVADGLLDTPEA